jgi:hypothetical protein
VLLTTTARSDVSRLLEGHRTPAMWEKKLSPALFSPRKAFKRFKLFLLSPPSHAAMSILLYFDR